MTRFLSFIKRALASIAATGLAVTIASAAPQDGAERTTAQLEQLVAPIALHPDALLSQILMASTYPLEVVEAARWRGENPGVTGTALEDAMHKQTWDPSVKALTSVPPVLQMMNDKLQWTRDLGDAFLAQQPDLLAAVQRLRGRADASGNLNTTPQQKVTKSPAPTPAPVQSGASNVVYSIEPTAPEEYFVPIYDPNVVYGTWPYAEYVPDYWYPSGYAASRALAFAAGIITGAAIWGRVDWWRNRVDVNVNNFNRFNRTAIANREWSHNPAHRGGVPYRDAHVAQRFGDQKNAAAREAFRSKADAGRRDMAKQGGINRGATAKQGGVNRAAAARPGGANRAAAKAAAGAKRPATANRPVGQGARAKASTQVRPAAHRSVQRPHAAARMPARAHVGFAGGGGRGMAMHGGGRSMAIHGGMGGRGGFGRGGGGRRR